MSEFLTIENLLAFLTLAGLEIVLGIDNIVFLAITTDRLPEAQKPFARKAGLLLAMFERILLISVVSWIAKLTTPLFHVFNHEFSGRDLILIGGGIFLLTKATLEIHNMGHEAHSASTPSKAIKTTLFWALLQIFLLDTIFSFDSVITAVGMVDNLWIMILSIVVAVLVMMTFAHTLSEFILKHPTLKTLALSFLLLIGVFLIADGLGHHIEKGYIYFAICFSTAVEALNFRAKQR